MEYNEIYEDTWAAREKEWSPYVKNDVISTAFCYARFTKVLEDLTNFSMKNSKTLLSLPNNKFNSLSN